MKRTLIAALVATAFAAPALCAKEPNGHLFDHELLASNDQADAWRRWADEFSHEMRTSLGTMFGSRVAARKVVKGAPYSADVVTEANQPLADGNVISKKTSGAVYRDGEGRTRQESGGDGKERTVHISDPVEGKHIVLTPESKKATVTPRAQAYSFDTKDKRLLRFGPTEMRFEDGKLFIDGKEILSGKIELKAGGKEIRIDGAKVTIDGLEMFDTPKVVVRTITEDESGDGTRREEVRVQIVKSGDAKEIVIPMPAVPIPPPPRSGHVHPVPPVPPVPPLPGASVMRFESTARLGKGTTTSLGQKDFDGVRAEGKSTLWVIPAGEVGNRNPIRITSESWYSPDLQVTVYSRYSDPRQGESIYRLAGIRRGEPSAELFKVPEGYETRGRGKNRERGERG